MLEFCVEVDKLPLGSGDKTLKDVGMEVHEEPKIAPDYIGFSKISKNGLTQPDSIYMINNGSSYDIHITPKGGVMTKEQISVCLKTASNYLQGIEFAHHEKPIVKLYVYDKVGDSVSVELEHLIAVLSEIKTQFFN